MMKLSPSMKAETIISVYHTLETKNFDDKSPGIFISDFLFKANGIFIDQNLPQVSQLNFYVSVSRVGDMEKSCVILDVNSAHGRIGFIH